MKRVVKTICQMCYLHCGLNVTVEDGRIERVEGMREHPANHGRLCPKGLASSQLVSDPNRLRTPMRRVGERGEGRWAAIPWDEALDEIASKLLETRHTNGPESVGFWRGQGPGWKTNYNYVARFMNAWGSPNLFTHGQLCFQPRAIAHAATFGGFPEPDFEHSQCIVLIGYNPVYTLSVNHAARIVWAKERGAKLIVVDPRFSNTASKADVFLQPRAGTTGALVLAMIQVIIEEGLYDADFIAEWGLGFDEFKEFVQDYRPEVVEKITWVPADKIRATARMMGAIKPLVVVEGNGLDQHSNTMQTARTTSILRALLRTIDEVGGGVLPLLLPVVDMQLKDLRPADFNDNAVLQYPLFFKQALQLTGVEFTDSTAIKPSPPIKALMVQGGDPVTSLSDSKNARASLLRTELLVVHDLYPTHTAQIADIVLPAASFLERNLLMYYRFRTKVNVSMIAMQNKCVEPVGESWSDLDLLFALARRVGLETYFPWDNVEQAFDEELAPLEINVAWLREQPGGYSRTYEPKELYQKYKRVGFSTPSKKIQFVASEFAALGLDPLPRFVEPALSPLAKPETAKEYPLTCSASLKLGIHSHAQYRTLPWIREIEPDPFAEIHPTTAKSYSIRDGEWIEVASPNGSIRVRARVSAGVHPQMIIMPHGYGQAYTGKDQLDNLITSQSERDPASGATSNRVFLCRVKKVEE
ncbi:MAG: molybdopterin-dependent oxidoreductase [Anaerolineales bacterium]|nr:molybdopterin-dependent oxidoreductase [Anaerolineales bacterium]